MPPARPAAPRRVPLPTCRRIRAPKPAPRRAPEHPHPPRRLRRGRPPDRRRARIATRPARNPPAHPVLACRPTIRRAHRENASAACADCVPRCRPARPAGRRLPWNPAGRRPQEIQRRAPRRCAATPPQPIRPAGGRGLHPAAAARVPAAARPRAGPIPAARVSADRETSRGRSSPSAPAAPSARLRAGRARAAAGRRSRSPEYAGRAERHARRRRCPTRAGAASRAGGRSFPARLCG